MIRIKPGTSRLVENAIYMLEMRFGTPITIVKNLGIESDLLTGARTKSTQEFRVKRAIVLPEMLRREVDNSISQISFNKQMVMGGTIDYGDSNFLVRRSNCPNLPDLTADDWILHAGYRYQVHNFQRYEDDCGWIIRARRIDGDDPPVTSDLVVEQGAGLQEIAQSDNNPSSEQALGFGETVEAEVE